MVRKKTNGAAPEGFTEIDNSIHGFWKPDTIGQTLQGIVGEMIVTKGAEDKDNKFYSIRITNAARCVGVMSEDKPVDVEPGILVGAGGATLLSFLAAHEGREVFLIFDGMGKKKGSKNPPKMYKTYVKDHDPSTGEVIG